MINELSSWCRKCRSVLAAFGLGALIVASACQSKPDGNNAQVGIIIVNAPATGEVRRVLVREGMSINEGTPIVEIAVRTEAQGLSQGKSEDPQARAGRSVAAARSEIEAARSEVVRTEVEVQRLTPLVASGQAPQAQLDAARAVYERAQQRLQQSQRSAQDAQVDLVTARQPAQNSSTAPPSTSEQIVAATASSAGTVSVINTRVGDRVVVGQPLATLRAGQP